MKREDDQQLWDFLGRAAKPSVSPLFARNVIRRVRQEPRRFAWMRPWLSPRRLVPAAGLAAAIIVAVTTLHHPVLKKETVEAAPDVIANIDPQDYDVVADLDELLASDESSLWDEGQTL
jgi:hypothetical protein